MINQEWLNQIVNTINRWDANYCIADGFGPQHIVDRKLLDQFVREGRIYKHDQTTTVARIELEQDLLVLKRYNPRSFGHKIKRALRQSRASRCWQMSYVFARAGLNVAKPIFMFEERFFFIRKHAYFANEYLPGEELLEALPNMDETEQLKVVQVFKQAMESMRAHKISHGDMKASNMLWLDGELFFIDLDAARQHDSSSSWFRANKRDRKRFLKNWKEHPELMSIFSWLE